VNNRISQAPTRTATARRPADHRGDLLEIGQVITSPETRLEYHIERLLGQGGFGQVYLAERRGTSTLVPETVCIKISRHIDGWLREAAESGPPAVRSAYVRYLVDRLAAPRAFVEEAARVR